MPLRLRHIIFLFALLLGASLTHVQAAIPPTGDCGDRKPNAEGIIVSDSNNVQWTLFSDSVAFVGEGAMGTSSSSVSSQASNIKKAFFSKGITFIGRYSLSHMNFLEQITVDPENPNYESPDNCNCVIEKENEKDKNILLFIGNGFIPEGVEVLRNYALCDNYRLTSITIPRSVKQMGEKTHHQEVGNNESPIRLPSLTEIHVQWISEEELPVWVADKFILNANKITLYVPCGTKSIYQNASPWNTCKAILDGTGKCGTNLTWSICDSVLTISGTGEMTNWSSSTSMPWYGYRNEIKHVVIEEGVTSIGYYAFFGMDKIVTVTNPSTLKTIGKLAFKNCKKLESINFPEGLTTIGTSGSEHGPFYECNSLKSIYIPKTVTFISKDCFLRCHGLTSIVVDPENPIYDSHDNCNAIIETAKKKLWYGCSTTVIPDGVLTVADYAFEYQHNLRSIRISNTVTSFGYYVFKECENLKDIYVEWTTYPPQYLLTSWEPGHTNLDATITVHVPCGCKNLYTSSYWNRYKIVDDHRTGGICGANGSNLTWMLSCDGVLNIKGIGAMKTYASTSERPWKDYTNDIKKIILEEGITEIGGNAFVGCDNVDSIVIPKSVITIGECAFRNCYGLTDIYVSWTEKIPKWKDMTNSDGITLHIPCGTKDLYEAENGWQNYTISDGSVSGTCGPHLTWFLSCDGVLTISGTGDMYSYWIDKNDLPSWYPYKDAITSVIIEDGVTSIGQDAFRTCFSLTSVTIPNSVKTIKDAAFFQCSSLTSITIPNSVTTLGGGVCRFCTALTDIYVSWIESIPGRNSLTNNDPPSSVTLHFPCSAIDLYQAAPGWNTYTLEGEGGPYPVTVNVNDDSMGSVKIEIIE